MRGLGRTAGGPDASETLEDAWAMQTRAPTHHPAARYPADTSTRRDPSVATGSRHRAPPDATKPCSSDRDSARSPRPPHARSKGRSRGRDALGGDRSLSRRTDRGSPRPRSRGSQIGRTASGRWTAHRRRSTRARCRSRLCNRDLGTKTWTRDELPARRPVLGTCPCLDRLNAKGSCDRQTGYGPSSTSTRPEPGSDLDAAPAPSPRRPAPSSPVQSDRHLRARAVGDGLKGNSYSGGA